MLQLLSLAVQVALLACSLESSQSCGINNGRGVVAKRLTTTRILASRRSSGTRITASGYVFASLLWPVDEKWPQHLLEQRKRHGAGSPVHVLPDDASFCI
jgi:hypothetical protein